LSDVTARKKKRSIKTNNRSLMGASLEVRNPELARKSTVSSGA
jgi:hypothetical protein